MIFNCTAIHPVKRRIAQHPGQIVQLDQHTGGIAGQPFIIGDLERPASRRRAEIDEHGDDPPIKIEPLKIKPVCCKRTAHNFGEESGSFRRVAKGCPARTFPPGGFQREEFGAPACQLFCVFECRITYRSLIAQPIGKAAQFLALLGAHGGFEIVRGG